MQTSALRIYFYKVSLYLTIRPQKVMLKTGTKNAKFFEWRQQLYASLVSNLYWYIPLILTKVRHLQPAKT